MEDIHEDYDGEKQQQESPKLSQDSSSKKKKGGVCDPLPTSILIRAAECYEKVPSELHPHDKEKQFMTKAEICNQVAEKMRELSNEEKLKNRPNEYDQEKWIAHFDADGPGWNTRIWKVLLQRFKKRMDEKSPKIGATGRPRI